jgi:hypothetical protein
MLTFQTHQPTTAPAVKPQIVIGDMQGLHNIDPEKTTARLIKGGSWKKQRIVVILPAGAMMPAKAALSHWNLIFPPNNGICRILALGQEVGEAYSNTIEQVILHPELSQWEYILTIESDNCPPSDGVIKLLERMEAHPEMSCIGGLYYTKGEGGVPQIWGDPKEPLNFRPQLPVPGQMVECCGTGMGFNLWRMGMFKDARLRKPWFKTTAGKDGVGTQDLYAWSDFRKYGYRCAIDCDVCVGHLEVERDIVW